MKTLLIAIAAFTVLATPAIAKGGHGHPIVYGGRQGTEIVNAGKHFEIPKEGSPDPIHTENIGGDTARPKKFRLDVTPEDKFENAPKVQLNKE